MTHASRYFYGNEISNYGLENGYVDYGTLAKSFDAVLNNNILQVAEYWEEENTHYFQDTDGNEYTDEEAEERREALQEELDTLRDDEEANEGRISEIDADLEALEEYHYYDIFQYYIVSDNAADILREAGEPLFYNDNLDMYVWGITHYGTAWNYVLTNIKLELNN